MKNAVGYVEKPGTVVETMMEVDDTLRVLLSEITLSVKWST